MASLIHRVLQDGRAAAGTIKLVLKEHPEIARVADKHGQLPLHIACRVGKDSAVKYLIDVYEDSLKVKDGHEELPLHIACRQNVCGMVNYILSKSIHGTSVPDSKGRLPIQSLMFDALCDRKSRKYVEAVNVLLRANPQALANLLVNSNHCSRLGAVWQRDNESSSRRLKRKHLFI